MWDMIHSINSTCVHPARLLWLLVNRVMGYLKTPRWTQRVPHRETSDLIKSPDNCCISVFEMHLIFFPTSLAPYLPCLLPPRTIGG